MGGTTTRIECDSLLECLKELSERYYSKDCSDFFAGGLYLDSITICHKEGDKWMMAGNQGMERWVCGTFREEPKKDWVLELHFTT